MYNVMMSYLNKKQGLESYKSPMNNKKLVEQYPYTSAVKTTLNSPIMKSSLQSKNNNYWTTTKQKNQQTSPNKKKCISLSKNYSESRRPTRSLKKQQKSIIIQQLRQQIQIRPNFQAPFRSRQPHNQKLQIDSDLFYQISRTTIPNYQGSKYSSKKNGFIQSYAANTNQGIVRNYNQDRVAIILNLFRPQHVSEDKWKKCAFFGVYDGHGGTVCADYLRDNLHHLIVKNPQFPDNTLEAIKNGFNKAQINIMQLAQNKNELQKSGSCAITVFLVGQMVYVSNVGDSRAIMSTDSGSNLVELSIDHKPTDQHQQARIIQAGGKIYQTKLLNPNYTPNMPPQHKSILGPVRVLPGRLSVTRTFGDAQAKLTRLGGNPNVIISKPQIKYFKLYNEIDFIVLASDGIFDKISSKQLIQVIWQTARKQRHKFDNVHQFSGLAIQNVMKLAVSRKTTDNITVVMIGFQNLVNKLFVRKRYENYSESKKRYQGEQSSIKKNVFKKQQEEKQNLSYSNINYYKLIKQKQEKQKRGAHSYYQNNKSPNTVTSYSNLKTFQKKKY